MLYDLGKMDLVRKYLENGVWIAVVGAGACLGLFFGLTVILIIARIIAWAWGWA